MKTKNQTLEEIAKALAHNNNNYILRYELTRLYVATVDMYRREELNELKTDICP